MEFVSKLMEIGLESSWSISQMESLWGSFQYQWKLVWIALGQFPHGILKEFFSISMEICLERILMEFSSESMKIGPESSCSISQWNPYGIPFNINGNLSGENPYGIPFKSLRNSFHLHWEFVCREPLRNSFQNQWEICLEFPAEILKESIAK